MGTWGTRDMAMPPVCVPCDKPFRPTPVGPAAPPDLRPTPLQLGATVPDGQMAMEELLLMRMMKQHRARAMDAAAQVVLTDIQVETLTKANELMQSASTQEELMQAHEAMRTAQEQIQAGLTEDQHTLIEQHVNEDLQRVTDALVSPQVSAPYSYVWQMV